MAIRTPLEASIEPTPSTVTVTAGMGSAGQALSAVACSSVQLTNTDPGRNPLEYKVGADAWKVLEASDGVPLAVNLATTTVMVRKGNTTAGGVRLGVVVQAMQSTQPVGGAPSAVDPAGKVISGTTFAVRGGVSLDSNSLVANVITESSGGAMVDSVAYGGGTQFDFHWFHKLNAILGGHMHVVKNHAVGGSALSTILTRWETPATNPLLDDTDVLFLAPAAINSVNPTLSDDSVAAILSQYEQLISRASAAKKVVIASSEWPVAVGWSGYARVHLIPYLNAQFAEICARYTNVIYCDSYSVLVDSTTDNGDVKSGLVRADFIHPTKKLAAVLAPYLAGVLAGRLIITESRTYSRISPAWSGTAGTRNARGAAGLTTAVTGDNPMTGWDLSITAGPASATGVSVVAARNDLANKYVVTVENTSATDLTIELQQKTSSHASTSTGSKVFARAGIGASSMVNIKQTDVHIQRSGSSTTPICARLRTNYAEDQRAFKDVPVTAEYTLAAGITDLRAAVVIKVGATTGAAVFELELPELNLVTS